MQVIEAQCSRYWCLTITSNQADARIPGDKMLCINIRSTLANVAWTPMLAGKQTKRQVSQITHADPPLRAPVGANSIGARAAQIWTFCAV